MSAPRLVLLAAGASERLGACKALVDLAGRSALERLLAAGAAVCAPPALVVTGRDHGAIAEALRGRDDARALFNAAWRRGRTGGLKLAVRAAPACDLVVAPVDVPLVAPATFAALVAAWDAAGRPPGGWLAPAHAVPGSSAPARPGHPVLAGRELVARALELDDDAPLRELRGWARPLWTVEVDDGAVLDDLDTPEDLARLRERASR